ncbi:MAG: sigma 54-interacting transcriptional regulator [Treponema sp.]|jgi:Nif-specific regulatory protein|nr:sigma 54-interacting transcriptional regulator [Treponema sp.]
MKNANLTEIALDLAELELLFDITRTFDKYVELQAALGPLLSLLEMRAELTRGMVTLLDRSTGLLKIEEACGLTHEEKQRGIYRLGEGLVGRVFESGQTITVPDLSKESRFLNRAKNRTRADMAGLSYYCVPIRSGDGVIGTLSAERRIQDIAPETQIVRDRAFLEKISSIIADSAKLRQRILDERFRSIQREEAVVRRGTIEGGRIAEGSKLIGTSNALRDMYELLCQVAASNATVLLTGESGTGKELVANEIHRLSRRVGELVKINCAALPESIIESELFGHEKGAFTGATSQRKGRFELAHRGTLFLDEIGEVSPQTQVKLLRVLQERELERVGGTATIKVDVRLIAATNRNLEEAVQEGRFREDLYYRLNVFPVRVPSLRERTSDIMLLADYFTEKYATRNNKTVSRISASAIELLTRYSWPGNVRELENCVERAVILSSDAVIHAYNLPPSLQSAVSTKTEPTTTLSAALSRLEKELIEEALTLSEGNMALAARRLGITERQIGLRVRHYGIKFRRYRPTQM